ncbi:potassium transporter [Raoultella terrigena]|uniref:Potassium transporter n=1 Tax=Raoultella terrigena TaxID=577 RepID=A0A485AWF0_RAOTE|nr:potassium transporter [Raoultella terrigena]
MHFRAITRIVGLLSILFSGTMILPGLVALIYRDGAGRAVYPDLFRRFSYWLSIMVAEPP